MKAEIILFHV